jgi:inner membrane protein
MDSLTQIVLGAAMGEAVLGKKIGNRAMVWGALGGTIPDLDVIGNLWMDEVDALAFHRGISHSFFFAIIAAFVMAFLTDRLYSWKKKHRAEFTVGAGFYVFIMAAMTGVVYIASKSIVGVVISLGVLGFGLYRIYQDLIVNKDDYERPSIGEWRWLWLLALITHPILDSFTQYGTQLLAPFSNYRAAISNISVADPAYTGLFLIGLISASLFYRSDRKRQILNWTGIGLSSLYMIWTLFNKSATNQIMTDTLDKMEVDYTRFTTSPSILNNILWSGTAESDSMYYQGLYSMLDKEPTFKLNAVPKNHKLIADARPDDHTINTLKWFSDNYYTVLRRKDGRLQFNDMRFGTFRGETYEEDDFIFRFVIEKGADGYYKMLEEQGGPPPGSEEQMMKDLTARIKGI